MAVVGFMEATGFTVAVEVSMVVVEVSTAVAVDSMAVVEATEAGITNCQES
jgi:hypothetical protein